jgi:Tfp pilus assembly protein PilO
MRWSGFTSMGGSTASRGGNGKSPTHTRLRIALIALLGLNALLLALVFHRPGFTLPEQQAELVRARERRDAARNAVAQMRDLRSKLQDALQNGNQFAKDHFLARGDGFSTILEDLESRASAAGLRPGGITYQLQDEQDQPGWTGVDVTLAVEGNYPDLVRFIHQLEQSDLFWIINGINVSGSADRELRMNLLMQTYFLPS